MTYEDFWAAVELAEELLKSGMPAPRVRMTLKLDLAVPLTSALEAVSQARLQLFGLADLDI